MTLQWTRKWSNNLILQLDRQTKDITPPPSLPSPTRSAAGSEKCRDCYVYSLANQRKGLTINVTFTKCIILFSEPVKKGRVVMLQMLITTVNSKKHQPLIISNFIQLLLKLMNMKRTVNTCLPKTSYCIFTQPLQKHN